MFDNPNQELKKLEEQLLQAEMTDAEFDRFFGELYDEYGPVEETAHEMEDLLGDAPVSSNVRNYANGYGHDGQMRQHPNRQTAPRQTGAQQRPVQQRPVQQRPVQQRPAQQRAVPQNAGRTGYTESSRYAAPAKKQKGIKGLVITACVECAGIVAVVLWWVLRIL